MDPYVVLIEDRDGAGNQSTGSHFASEGEKRSRDGRQQKKMAGATGLWKRRGVEKSKNRLSHPAWKSRKPAGFPLSHSLGDCGRLTKTGHFICYEKGTFLNVVRMGTFLMSVDIQQL